MATTEWFLRTDAHELGPLSFEELIVLVKAGALTKDDFVRPASRVAWQGAQSVPGLLTSTTESPPPSAWSETVTSALASVDARRRAGQRHRSSKGASLAGRSFGRGGASLLGRATSGAAGLIRGAVFSLVDNVMYVGEKIWRSPILRIATLGGVLVAMVAVGYSAIPASWLISTASAVDTVEQIGRDFEELRNRHASPSERESFAEESRRRLATIVPLLEQRASRDQAARELVWAARDCLSPMIAAGPDQPQSAEKLEGRFRNHLARAKKRVGQSSRQGPLDATTIGLVLVDVVVIAVLIRAFSR